MNFRRFKNWLIEIFLWAYEARLAFCFFIVLLMAFLFGFYTWSSEQSIRISGCVLQFIGMCLAIRGLLNIRAHFDQPPLKKLSIAWWHRFPRWEKHYVMKAERGVYSLTGTITGLEVWTPDNPEDSLEKRIDGIVKNQERLRKKEINDSKQIDKLQKNQKKYQKEHELAIVNMENQTRSDLESLHTDDILESLVGLIWLTFGIFMSTMSQELSKIFQ